MNEYNRISEEARSLLRNEISIAETQQIFAQQNQPLNPELIHKQKHREKVNKRIKQKRDQDIEIISEKRAERYEKRRSHAQIYKAKLKEDPVKYAEFLKKRRDDYKKDADKHEQEKQKARERAKAIRQDPVKLALLKQKKNEYRQKKRAEERGDEEDKQPIQQKPKSNKKQTKKLEPGLQIKMYGNYSLGQLISGDLFLQKQPPVDQTLNQLDQKIEIKEESAKIVMDQAKELLDQIQQTKSEIEQEKEKLSKIPTPTIGPGSGVISGTKYRAHHLDKQACVCQQDQCLEDTCECYQKGIPCDPKICYCINCSNQYG